MQYFNENFNSIRCPYGLLPLDKELNNIDKNVVVMTVDEYWHIDSSKFKNTFIDMLFLYEWSGTAPIPDKFPIQTFVMYYDYKITNKFNIFYYPQWLFYIADTNINFTPVISTEYLLSCACRNFNDGRPGKILNYQRLKNKSYFDKILITKFKSTESFNINALPETNNIEFKLLVDDFLIDYDTWQPWDNLNLELVNSMTTTDLDVYKKSLFAIIAETYIHKTILSEKTFKIFAVGQIPIMCGAQHAIKHLRQLGFDVFDDIVDHSYDEIADWQDRIIAMHNCLDKIVKLNHRELLEKTYTRRLQNSQYLQSNILHKMILDPIVKQITG
jgi:hypothetical protein